MKSIIILFFCSLIGNFSNAQIANGSLAPNFSGVDIKGNSYNLHNILGSGKGVILDFSTAWCGPCLTMHRSHFFDRIYKNYGPQGTNELVVLFLESDNSTTLADLQGTGNLTVGDFTACTELPILDNMASAAANYQVPGFPSFFVIDPADSTTHEFSIFNHTQIMSYLVTSGIINQPLLDAGIGYTCVEDTMRYVCSGANNFVPQFDLYNFGASTLTALTFDIFVNGAFHSSQSWTGNILPFKGEELLLNPITVVGAAEISVIINQAGSANLANDTLSLNVQLTGANTLNKVMVEIKTDNSGAYTYWHISDDAGNIIANGGNPWVGTTNIGVGFGASAPQTPQGTYMSNQTYLDTVTLNAAINCYKFVITDYYGGGINSTLGGYKVTNHLGNVLFSGAEFDDIVVHPILNNVVSSINNQIAITNTLIYPNPVHDRLNLSMMDLAQADIAIFDLQGRKVYQAEWNQKPILISHLGSGFYILKISSGNRNWTKNFIKE